MDDRLSLALARYPGLAAPLAVWQHDLGDLWPWVSTCLSASKDRAQGWLCGVPGGEAIGCARRVVELGDDRFSAVCDAGRADCHRVTLERAHVVRHRLDLVKLAQRLVEGLPFHGTPARVRDASAPTVVLGSLRPAGRHPVVLTRASTVPALREVAARLQKPGDIPPLVLYVSGLELADEEQAVARALGLAVQPLAGVVRVEGDRLVLDLSSWVLANRAADFDPTPWIKNGIRLLMDPVGHRAWFDGALVTFDQQQRAMRLLSKLASHAGDPVTYREIARAIWGEPDDDGVYTDLFSVKRDTVRIVKQATGVDLPIVNIEARGSHDGVYRLDLSPGSVRWWSDVASWEPLARGRPSPRQQKKQGSMGGKGSKSPKAKR